MLTKPLYIALLALLFTPQIAIAAEFNPSNIITDAELFDSSSMTKSAIQAFLDSRHSTLSTYRAYDPLTNKRELAADIIFNSSREYGVNPRFLLVTLQKEQSLVEAQNPSTRAYDWAMGYAVCDSCKTTDPQIQKHKGFGKQVDDAAGAARWWHTNQSHGSFKKVGKTITIDSTSVTPANYATGFLYTYTPHIHGNKNFWKIWNRWFSRLYPNGTVVQVKGQDGVYLIEKGFRRGFSSKAALLSRYEPSQIISIEESELLTYEEGPEIKFPAYSLLRKPNGMIFLLRDDTVHYIASNETFRQLGYNPDEVIDVEDGDVESFYQGKIITLATIHPLGAVLKDQSNNNLYYVEQGKRQPILHEDIAKVLFPTLTITTVSHDLIKEYPLIPKMLTFKEGTLVAAHDSPLIYVISDGARRHIPSEEVFAGLGYKWENIVHVTEQALLGSPLGDSVELNTTN